MGKKRMDWEALKIDFMRGNYANLKEFADAKGISHGTIRNRCSGWMAEKANYRERVTDLAVSGTLEEDVMTAAQRNLHHVALWDSFLGIVQDAFNNFETIRNTDGSYRVGTVERLANVMEKAQKGQRIALGMDRETKDAKGLLSEISAAISAAKSAYIEDDADETQQETT
jgi:hypothetical protein